jgi:NAD(P)-dependent dehydrogenase (short-subunit alcohol dehydrogenase family)
MKNHILITGAANGLGKALAEIFAENNLVFAVDVDADVIENYKNKKSVFPFIMDVTDEDSIHQTFLKIKKITTRIDILINNAGISGFYPLLEASEKQIQQIDQINTFGPYRITKEFFPLLLEARGKVINLSSESVKFPTLFQPYPASKIAMEGLMKSVGQELFLKGIQTTFIRPGAIKTRMLEELHSLKKEKANSMFKEEFDQFIVKAPKREGRPKEPEYIAHRIYRISQKKKLKHIYRINNNPLLDLASVLPSGLVNRMMKKFLRH